MLQQPLISAVWGRSSLTVRRPQRRAGLQMSDSQGLTIAELEAKYFLYRKALKQLLLEGRPAARIEKTLCWSRLETLHNCLPRQYKSPDHIRHQLRREIEREQGDSLQRSPVSS